MQSRREPQNLGDITSPFDLDPSRRPATDVQPKEPLQLEWTLADTSSRISKQPAKPSPNAMVAILEKRLAKYQRTSKEALAKIKDDA